MTFLGPETHRWAKKGAANHQEMILRIYWDGRKEPDVEAPVGDFFAAGFGERMEVRSIPVQVERDGLQLLLADAVSEVRAHRGQERQRQVRPVFC